MTLRLGPRFTFPDEYVTHTGGVLARKRAGKSNAAVVLAEEMYAAGIPWVAVDPKGDWWGVRSSGDGKGPGLAVVVFGGEHGDVPLEPSAGRFLADLIAERRLTCILDVSEMSKADQRRFLTEFAERLYKVNRQPLHVFCEEADEYIPQRVMGEMARLVGAFETLVKRGGFRGIGVTLITQRSASLNKDVLTQVDTLIVLQTTGPQDRKAILDWVVQHDLGRQVVDELPGLAVGEAWVFSPAWLPESLAKVQFRRRRTFDSGSTPEIGAKRVEPTRLADVDLAHIKAQMEETIQRAKADDPKELRRRIAELERQLRERPTEPVTVEVPVEVQVLDEALVARIEVALAPAAALLHVAGRALSARADLTSALADPHPAAQRERRPPRPAPVKAADSSPTAPAADGDLPGPQRKLLTVLAVHGPRTKRQLAMQAGYAIGGGAFNNPLGRLRSNGWVEPAKGEPMTITDAGLAALGDFDPLPSGPELLDQWLAQLPGPPTKLLAAIAERGTDGWDRDELAAATGYSPQGGAFNNPLGKLRTLELVARGLPIRLTDEFAEAIR